MLTVAVIGAGTMGRGIMQWAAEAGCSVLAFDQRPGAAQTAREFVGEILERSVRKARLDAAARDAIMSRIGIAGAIEELAGSDMVIEAIVEDVEAKRTLFRQLETVVGDTALLCTNTSSLSVTEIAFACEHPQRVAGLHFFNPVPLMRVVEIVRGERTDPSAIDRLLELVGRTGHRPVVCADSPGFVVNHAGRGLYTEGLRIVQESVAEPHVVDEVVRDAIGLPMGPFELFDLTGLDVSGRVLHEIYDAFYQEPRYRPTPMVRRRINAGLLGRKVGRGFYRYQDNRKLADEEAAVPSGEPGSIHLAFAGGRAETVAAILQAGGARLVARPDEADAILLAPEGSDATTAAVEAGLDPARCVAVDLMFDRALEQGGRLTVMGTPATGKNCIDGIAAALRRGGSAVSVIADSPGFIAQRVAASIVNTACEIAQQAIAAPASIDAGVTGGLGYPVGPLALGDLLGPKRVLAVLERLQSITGDPRYRPSLWLKRRALLGMSLREADGT